MGRPHSLFKDLAGQTFGRLTVLEYGKNVPGDSLWLCHCTCGNEKLIRSSHLRHGRTTSCGCRRFEVARDKAAKHCKHGTPEYVIWGNMTQRGEPVCKQWLKFEQFIADVGERPSPEHWLIREDKSRGFEPGNASWKPRPRRR